MRLLSETIRAIKGVKMNGLYNKRNTVKGVIAIIAVALLAVFLFMGITVTRPALAATENKVKVIRQLNTGDMFSLDLAMENSVGNEFEYVFHISIDDVSNLTGFAIDISSYDWDTMPSMYEFFSFYVLLEDLGEMCIDFPENRVLPCREENITCLMNDYYISFTDSSITVYTVDNKYGYGRVDHFTFFPSSDEYREMLLNFSGESKLLTVVGYANGNNGYREELSNVVSVEEYYYLPFACSEREGYIFTGWFYDEACTRPYNNEPITEDVNLYAGWERITFTVIYHIPDATGEFNGYTEEVTVNYGDTLPEKTLSESLTFRFLGWYTADGDGTPYNGEPVYSDMELIPRIETIMYTVTFNSNGGSSVDNQTVEYGMAVIAPTPTREGYDFVGWFYSTGTEYSSQQIINDTTLFARWSIKRLTVTFNSNGGNAVDNQMVDWGTAVIASTPTRRGYDFQGWYLGDNLYEGSVIKEDTVLVARWEIKKCKVTFYIDSEVYAEKVVAYGSRLFDVCEEQVAVPLKLVKTVSLSSGEAVALSDEGEMIVTEDTDVEIDEASETDSFVMFVKNNKVKVVVGVVGLLVIIVLVSVVASSVGRKKRRR